jgi:hypothetical protein
MDYTSEGVTYFHTIHHVAETIYHLRTAMLLTDKANYTSTYENDKRMNNRSLFSKHNSKSKCCIQNNEMHKTFLKNVLCYP